MGSVTSLAFQTRDRGCQRGFGWRSAEHCDASLRVTPASSAVSPFCRRKLWKEPSAFNPERFLSASGTEINKMESEKVMTFGLGKRRCLGESIGRWEVFLFLATLLQQLEFSLQPGAEVDITPQYGLTMKYKKCDCFQIKQRFPVKSSP